MRKLALVLVLFGAAVSVSAAEFVVNYVDGFLEVKDGSSWYEVFIGEEIPYDAVLKLDSGSYAELERNNEVIKLSRPGTYVLSELLSARSAVKSSGVASVVSGKFRTMVQDDSSRTQSAVGGVRASEAVTVTIDWMSSETSELIADGKKALGEEDYQGALSFFEEAYDFAADSYEEAEALYFVGLTYAIEGDYASALRSLDEAYIEGDSEYYTDFYLLKGQLLVDSFAFKEAYGWFSEYNSDMGKKQPSEVQEIYFLKAVSADNLGKKADAEKAVRAVIEIDPGSGTAAAARNYLDKM